MANASRSKAWQIVALLFLAQILNFFDKNVLGLAAVHLMAELNIDESAYGTLASSFYSLYALSGVIVGLFFAHKIPSKWLLLFLVSIWTVAQLPMIFSSSFLMLVAGRVLLGVGEGPGSPASMGATHEWFEDKDRALPTAIVVSGAFVGSLISAPILSIAMEWFGWKAGFVVCFVLGICWLVLWALFGDTGPDSPARKAKQANEGPAERANWTHPVILGCVTTAFCTYWVTGFTVAWLAPFVTMGLGFSPIDTGWILAGVWANIAFWTLSMAGFSQYLTRRDVPTRMSRGWVIGCGMIGGAVCMAVMTLMDDTVMKMIFLGLGISLPQAAITIGMATVSEVAPSSQKGRMIITIYSAITIAGLFAPYVAGKLINGAGLAGYHNAFLVNSVILFVGGISAFLLLRPPEKRIHAPS